MSDALERLLGVSVIKTGGNCLKKAACYTELEMGKFKKRKLRTFLPNDPMPVTEPALRRLVQNGTLGDIAAGDERAAFCRRGSCVTSYRAL